MSPVLVRTSITRLETMLKAATSTIMVRTMNSTLVWPWIAAKKPKLAWNQSNTQPCGPTAWATALRAAASGVPSFRKISMVVILLPMPIRRCTSGIGA